MEGAVVGCLGKGCLLWPVRQLPTWHWLVLHGLQSHPGIVVAVKVDETIPFVPNHRGLQETGCGERQQRVQGRCRGRALQPRCCAGKPCRTRLHTAARTEAVKDGGEKLLRPVGLDRHPDTLGFHGRSWQAGQRVLSSTLRLTAVRGFYFRTGTQAERQANSRHTSSNNTHNKQASGG